MSSIKGENTKQIEVNVKELNLSEREEFNDSITTDMKFSDYVKLCRLATDFTDKQLNEFTDMDIIAIGNLCYTVVNKKKLTK